MKLLEPKFYYGIAHLNFTSTLHIKKMVSLKSSSCLCDVESVKSVSGLLFLRYRLKHLLKAFGHLTEGDGSVSTTEDWEGQWGS